MVASRQKWWDPIWTVSLPIWSQGGDLLVFFSPNGPSQFSIKCDPTPWWQPKVHLSLSHDIWRENPYAPSHLGWSEALLALGGCEFSDSGYERPSPIAPRSSLLMDINIAPLCEGKDTEKYHIFMGVWAFCEIGFWYLSRCVRWVGDPLLRTGMRRCKEVARFGTGEYCWSWAWTPELGCRQWLENDDRFWAVEQNPTSVEVYRRKPPLPSELFILCRLSAAAGSFVGVLYRSSRLSALLFIVVEKAVSGQRCRRWDGMELKPMPS